MNIVFRYCSFLFISLCIGCTFNEKEFSTSMINGPQGQRLESILTPYVRDLRLLTDNQSGMAIGITQGNQIIYAKTFGYGNLQDSIPSNMNTLFHKINKTSRRIHKNYVEYTLKRVLGALSSCVSHLVIKLRYVSLI